MRRFVSSCSAPAGLCGLLSWFWFPRLILRFQNFAFGGERPVAGFLQLVLRVPDFILKFLKLFLGFARLVLGFQAWFCAS